jgi:hypothetical protein
MDPLIVVIAALGFIAVVALAAWLWSVLGAPRDEVMERIQRVTRTQLSGAFPMPLPPRIEVEKGGGAVASFLRVMSKASKPKEGADLTKVQTQLRHAGLRGPHTVEIFFGAKLMLGIVFAVLAYFFTSWRGPALSHHEAWVVVLAGIGFYFPNLWLRGRVQTRQGNRHPRHAPHGVYACAGLGVQGSGDSTRPTAHPTRIADDWIAIAVETEAQFAALCQVMGQPELAADARFADAPARHANQQALDEIIDAWTAGQEKNALQRRLQAAGVPAGAVLNVRELLADEHVQARDVFQEVEYPDLPRPFPHTRVAFKLRGRHASRIDTPAPRFGGANGAVLGDLLGLSAAVLADLYARGISATVPVATHGLRV